MQAKNDKYDLGASKRNDHPEAERRHGQRNTKADNAQACGQPHIGFPGHGLVGLNYQLCDIQSRRPVHSGLDIDHSE